MYSIQHSIIHVAQYNSDKLAPFHTILYYTLVIVMYMIHVIYGV